MKPMLAFKYQDNLPKLTWPQYVQPKLDGVRMIYRSGTMQSRSYGRDEEKIFSHTRFVHLRDSLASVSPNFILDGELYIHGKALQTINGLVSINSTEPRPNEDSLQYHVFDCINLRDLSCPFSERTQLLSYLLERLPSVHYVETHHCHDEPSADELYRKFKSQGYEGSIYRAPNSPYGLVHNCGNQENRWKYLLKRKDWLDAEFEIVGFELTEGSKGETGFNLHCLNCDGLPFAVGTGLSDLEVSEYALRPPVGRQAKLRFDSYSLDLIPLKAHVIEII